MRKTKFLDYIHIYDFFSICIISGYLCIFYTTGTPRNSLWWFHQICCFRLALIYFYVELGHLVSKVYIIPFLGEKKRLAPRWLLIAENKNCAGEELLLILLLMMAFGDGGKVAMLLPVVIAIFYEFFVFLPSIDK